MKYNIAGEKFSTKKDIKEYAKNIMQSHSVGETLNKQETVFMASLLERHPKYAAMERIGVKAISVGRNKRFGHKEFLITDKNGVLKNFSYKKCIYGEYSRNAILTQAFRNAVCKDTQKYKKEFFNMFEHENIFCPFVQKKLTRKNTHVDHAPPHIFRDIVLDFISEYTVEIDSIEVIKPKGECMNVFADKKLAKDFREFHGNCATLRIISETANTGVIRALQSQNIWNEVKVFPNIKQATAYSSRLGNEPVFNVSPDTKTINKWWSSLTHTTILSGEITHLKQQQYLSWLRRAYLRGKHTLTGGGKWKTLAELTQKKAMTTNELVYMVLVQFAERFREGWDLDFVCNCKSEFCHAYIIRDAIMGIASLM